MSVALGHSALHGRGVFAQRAFREGEVVERAPVLVVPARQLADLDRTVLYDYYYSWNQDQDAALAMGLGSFYNHAVHPNANYFQREADGVIDYVALRDIAAGEEITIHYNGDPGDPGPVWFQERK